MVVLFTVAIAAPINGKYTVVIVVLFFRFCLSHLGQAVDITSELDAADRNFSCTDEFVTYTCGGLGEILTVNAPPVFIQHVFISEEPVPAAAQTPSSVLTLTNRLETNSSFIFNYTANLQIRVLNDTRIMVSCSTNDVNSASLPLIHECKFLLN